MENVDKNLLVLDDIARDGQLSLGYMRIDYLQTPDCTESGNDDDQKLTIETRNGGGGHFLHIITEGWSIDSADEITKCIEDFKTRLELNAKYPYD